MLLKPTWLHVRIVWRQKIKRGRLFLDRTLRRKRRALLQRLRLPSRRGHDRLQATLPHAEAFGRRQEQRHRGGHFQAAVGMRLQLPRQVRLSIS